MASKNRVDRVEFTVHGPFDIPLRSVGAAELDVQAFWRSAAPAKLRDRSGCYVFAVERVKGALVPHYVGRTKRGFVDEVFNPPNLVKYRRAVRATPRGRPVLFLIVPRQRGGKASKRYIGEVETFLIQAGAARNPEIQNVKGVPRPKWFIRGVAGVAVGKPPQAARKLRASMERESPSGSRRKGYPE